MLRRNKPICSFRQWLGSPLMDREESVHGERIQLASPPGPLVPGGSRVLGCVVGPVAAGRPGGGRRSPAPRARAAEYPDERKRVEEARTAGAGVGTLLRGVVADGRAGRSPLERGSAAAHCGPGEGVP